MAKQLSNAQEKVERAQRHAEDKRQASQQAIERLQQEYENMALERRDNDKQVEETRKEADEVERKVRGIWSILRIRSHVYAYGDPDGRTSKEERGRVERVVD